MALDLDGQQDAIAEGLELVKDLRILCRAGKRSGVREFGVSDHWVEHPQEGSDQEEWRLAPARLDEYVERLLKLKKELDDGDFTLRLGLEVDFFFENADEVLAKLLRYPFDYLIGSVHFAGIFSIDHDRRDWLPLSREEMAEICRIYWEKLEGAAARSEFAFLGHLDLPKQGLNCAHSSESAES